MSGVLIIQLLIAIMFLALSWIISKMEAYWLISGFATRPKEEQEELIKNGYIQKTAKFLFLAGVGILILLPLGFTSFTFAFEVQFGFMIFFILGGLIYLSKYEVKEKRKRSYIISSVLFFVVITGLSIMLFSGYRDSELIVKEQSFEITGMYGDEWRFEDIVEVELLQEMPEVTWKENGYGLSTLAKGHFKVVGHGSSLLFIHKQSSPYVYIKLDNHKDIFLNSSDPNETLAWFETLEEKVK